MIINSQSIDAEAAAETQRIYLQRSFSDEFHQFTEICLEKKPMSRWPVMKLLNHSFLKQCRHNSILSVTQRYGMQKADYDQLRGKITYDFCLDFVGDLAAPECRR